MDVEFEVIIDPERALELVPLIDRYAQETMSQYVDGPVPADVARDFVTRNIDRDASLFLVARLAAGGEVLGVCITVPFIDPLVGTCMPMIAVCHVDPNHRHRGLARAMVKAVGERLAARGFKELAARAAHTDDALVSMGERFGFVRQWELMVRE